MKTTLLSLLLSGAALWAQIPAAPAPPPAAPGSDPATRRSPAVRTNAAAVPGSDAVPAQPPRTIPRPSATPAPAPNAGATTPVPVPNLPSAPGPNAAGAVPAQTVATPPLTTLTNLPPEDMVPAGMIDFRGADLKDVLQLYAELVNRTVLRPANLPAAQIILKTQTQLTKREAIQALDAVLGLNGVGMVNVGEKFVKAVPIQQVNNEGAPFSDLKASELPEVGQYITHIVQLKYVKPTEMVQVIQPLQKLQGSTVPIDPSMILVLRDFAENVKRMLEIIAKVDVAVPSEFDSEVIPIKYALASEIATALNSLSSGGGGATVGRSTTTTGSRGTFGGSMGSGSMGAGGYRSGMNPMNPQQTSPFGQTATTPGAAGSFTDRLQNIIKRASVSGEIVVLGQTKIIADERTNALLVYASKEDMKVIKDIVSKLDVVLAQVLIEAVVIQVTIGDTKDIGVSYLQRPQSAGNWTGVGAINNTKGFNNVGDFINGTTNNALSGGFSYLAQFNNDLDILLKAVATDSRARIIQKPRIQTSHAVQAQFFVGQSRPYPTASYYGGGAYGGYSSIQQLQIGVTLDVTPLINPDGLVVMDFHQTIESYEGDVEIANVGKVPITSRKEAAAKVAVRDRDTIILGGMIQSDRSKSGSGVPWLMDVPLLGYLFRSTSSTKNRSEMIVLIRPTVLPTPEVAALTAVAEKNKMPGVRRVESEMEQEEAERIRQAEIEELKEKASQGKR